MEIKVIGAGCETCEALYANTRQALEQTGLSASVERVENLVEIVKLGVTQLPALVVGVPVGFVNVVEAKELFWELAQERNIPCIIARGRKGGSNVAAAIINALMLAALA